MAFVINVIKWLLWTVETIRRNLLSRFGTMPMWETQCGLSTRHAGLVVLTVGSEYKPTQTQRQL